MTIQQQRVPIGYAAIDVNGAKRDISVLVTREWLKALQELQDRITALEARVTALGG